MAKVFISYRRGDTRYQARHIFTALTEVLPRESIFMDIDSISPGANFRTVLQDWVSRCDIMLVLMTENWAEVKNPRTGKRRLTEANDFVRIEVASALERSIPVVPILIDAAELPSRASLPRDLRPLLDRQAEHLEFRTFDQDVQNLVKRLRLGDPSPGADESLPAFIDLDKPLRQPDDQPTKEADLGSASNPARPIELLDPVGMPAAPATRQSTPAISPAPDVTALNAVQVGGATPTHGGSTGLGKYLALAFAIAAPLLGFGLRFPLEIGGMDLTFLTTGAMLGVVAMALWFLARDSTTSTALLWFGCAMAMWASLMVGGAPQGNGPMLLLFGISVAGSVALVSRVGLTGNAIAVHWLAVSIALTLVTVGVSRLNFSEYDPRVPLAPALAAIIIALLVATYLMNRHRASTKGGGMLIYWGGAVLGVLTIFGLMGFTQDQAPGSEKFAIPFLLVIIVVWPLLAYRAWRNRKA